MKEKTGKLSDPPHTQTTGKNAKKVMHCSENKYLSMTCRVPGSVLGFKINNELSFCIPGADLNDDLKVSWINHWVTPTEKSQ